METLHRYKAIEKIGFNKSGFHSKFLELLEVELKEEFSVEKIQSVRIALENTDLFVLVEDVKAAVQELIYLSDRLPGQNIPDYISRKVNQNYILLNRLFFRNTGITIKRYINLQKIELVKDLLIYDDLDLSVIARKLRYQNETRLADEFLNETGVSPAFYRLLRNAG